MKQSLPTRMVEIRPTFKAKPGKFEDMKKFCKEVFVAGVVKAVETGTPDETACILYNFVVNEELETFICREGYTNAQGLRQHLANVDSALKQALELSDLVDLQVTGPKSELAMLKAELDGFNPTYYEEI